LKKLVLSVTVILLSIALLIASGCASPKVTLNISAAASLTDVITELNAQYMKSNNSVEITTNFASAGTLQKQIENGAPTDIFISAASKQMDAIQQAGLIIDDTRKNLLNNKVVLIVPLNSTLNLTSFEGLTGENVKKIALGDPKSVPAGQYGQKVFDQLGITDQIKDKFVLGSDVRQVLTYVEGGNVDAGIVYLTDAMTSTQVKVVAEAPANINESVIYPIAVIKSSINPNEARKYIDFLSNSQSKEVFEKYGFSVISE
jgi:molybdate transport system substrate-binding protein